MFVFLQQLFFLYFYFFCAKKSRNVASTEIQNKRNFNFFRKNKLRNAKHDYAIANKTSKNAIFKKKNGLVKTQNNEMAFFFSSHYRRLVKRISYKFFKAVIMKTI